MAELINDMPESVFDQESSLDYELDGLIAQAAQFSVDELLTMHKEKYNGSALKTGLPFFDYQLRLTPSDFITLQAMSNHGKTKFMTFLCMMILLHNLDSCCIYITYEQDQLKIFEHFINAFAVKHEENPVIRLGAGAVDQTTFVYNKFSESSKATIDQYIDEKRLLIMKGVDISKLEGLIQEIQKVNKNRRIVLFLDYFQIITNGNSKAMGWEEHKTNAYALESVANRTNAIIIAGSQVNGDRIARESADIYTASTNNIDLLNQSHPSIESGKHSDLYDPSVEIKGKKYAKIKLTIRKAKNCALDSRWGDFLFDGYVFRSSREQHSLTGKRGRKIQKPIMSPTITNI